MGLGSAYVTGFKWALERDYERVFEMDADFSHAPTDLNRFLETAEDADLVLGSRYQNHRISVVNWDLRRLILSYGANVYTRIVTGLPISDATGGFKCFRREALQALNLDKMKSDGYCFQIETTFKIWKKGLRVKEIPIIFTDRTRGTSKMSGGIISEAFFLVLKLRLGLALMNWNGFFIPTLTVHTQHSQFPLLCIPCSIIIVAYNSCDFIPACLKSVRDACEGIDAQIIVLDNGSVEPILPEIRQFFPEVEWIDSKENLGFGKGCNLAEKRATKPYLFFINPDTVVSRDSFTKVLDFMEEHPESGTVGCRILNEDGSLQWACRRSFPTIVSAVSKTIGLAALFPKNKTLASYNMTYADPDEVTEVDAISGSFFCMRRDLYEKLGGFDEDFFMYGEDLDLCFRAKVAGCKNYYTPSTNILHFKGQSCRTRRWDSYLDFYKAMLIFVKKHKDLYFVPNFLVSFGIMFAAFVGMFSRLIPKFWKMFLDLGVVAIWAFVFLPGMETSGMRVLDIQLRLCRNRRL